MNLSSVIPFAVRRWQFTLVLFLASIAIGLSSFFGIPKGEDPIIPIAGFTVVTVLPGASPGDLERLVADPLETRLKGLGDVKKLQSELRESVVLTTVEFTAGSDADRKRDDVLRETSALRPSLPEGIVRFDVERFSASNVVFQELALVARGADGATLDAEATRLRKHLETLPGVKDVKTYGQPGREIEIALDLEKMAAIRPPLVADEVVGAITAEARNIPAGSVDAGTKRYAVKTSGDYRSLAEIEATVVRVAGGLRGGTTKVVVGDVARVRLHDRESNAFARFDGERAILFGLTQKEGTDIFDVRARLATDLLHEEARIPEGLVLRRGFDQGGNVGHRLRGFTRDFAIAIALVLLTLLPLGTRASFVVMLSIPTSLLLGVTALHLTGFTINQLSIVGFVIALGLLVDDSVVVVENIARYLRDGFSPREAAEKATLQMLPSVLGCTATLVFAFLPLLALPGTAGQFIRSLPAAVVYTILASLVVSLTLVPFLASRLLKPENEHGNAVLRGLLWVIERSYRPVLVRALRHKKTALFATAIVVVATLALIPKIGFSVFPKAGIPQFQVLISLNEGASLDATLDATTRAEEVLRTHGARNVATSVGKGGPLVYYNVTPKNEQASAAEIFAELPTREPKEISKHLEEIRQELTTDAGQPGATYTVKEFENGPQLEAPIVVRLEGGSAEELRSAAATVEALLEATPGARSVVNPAKREASSLRVRVDSARADLAGVRPFDVDRLLRLAIAGVDVGSARLPGDEETHTLRVTLAGARGHAEGRPAFLERPSQTVLDRLFVPTAGGLAVPLGAVATTSFERSPVSIFHTNKVRSVSVTAEVAPGANTARVTGAVENALKEAKLPAAVRPVIAGERENSEETFGGMGAAILVAAFGILAVLVLEFGTFRATLIVASVIPLGVVGGLLGLFFTGNTLSFTATIGFIALLGIEVKNSILLVDFTNELRRGGMPLVEAVEKAGEQRFLPILLTTATAIGGLLPLAIEHSALYSPLAIVLLGGLIASTLLARIVTPIVYLLLPPAVEMQVDPPLSGADAAAPSETPFAGAEAIV